MEVKTVLVSSIIVPETYRKHPPTPYKIRNTYTAFIREGKQRPIIVNQDGVLLRGYPAFLTCCMFRVETIQVKIQEVTI